MASSFHQPPPLHVPKGVFLEFDKVGDSVEGLVALNAHAKITCRAESHVPCGLNSMPSVNGTTMVVSVCGIKDV
eukprot:13537454-Ditylum_brightwellii.AAC.1